MPEILPNSNFKNILFFMVVDLCVDNHFAESPHCLLTNISRDNYSSQPLGKKNKKFAATRPKPFLQQSRHF
jgi:hypothetical protein